MATKFTMEFDTGNAAFDDGNGPDEVRSILSKVAGRVVRGEEGGIIHDVNGNRIGVWSLELPEQGDDHEDEEE